MATVDYLNAPYARTPPKTETSLEHLRSLSTVSNVTLFTTTTTHSHPSEHLLQSTAPQTVNYDDQPDHIPTDVYEPIGRLPCEAPLVIHVNPMNKAEKQGYSTRNCRRTLKRWKWLKLGLRAALCEFSPNLANFRHCRSLSIVVAFLLLCECGLSQRSSLDCFL